MWWLIVMFVEPHWSAGYWYGRMHVTSTVFLVLGYLVTPFIVLVVLRSADWPAACPGDQMDWQQTYRGTLGCLLLLLVAAFAYLWLEGSGRVTRLWPGSEIPEVEWSTQGRLQGFQIDGGDNIFIYGYCCLGTWRWSFLGFRFSSSPDLNCLLNFAFPFWFLVGGPLVGGVVYMLLSRGRGEQPDPTSTSDRT